MVVLQQRGACEYVLKSVEGVFAFCSKAEGNVVLCQVNKRFRYDTIVADKTPVEITKTKEGLDTFDRARALPVLNNGDFVRVDF